jgi:hypothetical protein
MGTLDDTFHTPDEDGRDEDGPDIDALDMDGSRPPGAGTDGQDLAQVLASIRQLVSAETAARVSKRNEATGLEGVLILTPEMRVDDPASQNRSGEILTEGLAEASLQRGAPILDEEALRAVVNQIIREELQGELGDRISRNLRKLIRREIGAVLAEERASN